MNRVLHLIHTTGSGGAETVCLDIAGGLDPERWQGLVCVPGEGWITEEMRRRGIRFVLLPQHDRRAYLTGIVRLVREQRIDLVQAHLLGSCFYGSLAGLLAGIPVVSTFHGSSDVDARRTMTERLRYGIIQRGSHRLVLVSQPLRRELAERGHLADERTRVIVNGVDTDLFHPREDRSVRVELGVGDDEILVGAVGNVRPAKDYATFLRTAAELAARSPRYRFLIAGDTATPLFDQLTTLRAELGLGDRVIFAGFRSDAARVLNSLDVFLISSSSEGFSLAAVQAMASGIPVVATRCGGPEEIITHEVDGLLAPVGSPGELAAAVGRVVADDDLRARLTAAALLRARRDFSRRSMVSAYESLYREALLRPGRRMRIRGVGAGGSAPELR